MESYFIYYFAKYALDFLNPLHKNHDDTRSCIYDRKLMKTDILKSMKYKAFCDECRWYILKSKENTLSSRQINAPDKIFGKCVEIFNSSFLEVSSKRKKVFISYCHNDKEWLERIKIHLTPIERQGLTEIWSDTKILGGKEWKKKIERGLDEAKIAILLISADFSASNFIYQVELPSLLGAAENNGAVILPLILHSSLFTYNESLSKFQAINPPSKPLSSLDKSEQEKTLVNLAETVLEYLKE